MLAISGAFAELAILSTLVTLVAYVAGCVAAVVVQRRDYRHARTAPEFSLYARGGVGRRGRHGVDRRPSHLAGSEIAVLAAVAVTSLAFLAARRRRRGMTSESA